MKVLIINLLFLFGTLTSWSQDTFWRTYGSKSFDHGRCVKELNNGGFIICGATSSRGAGNTDAYLIKVDSVGKLDWSKSYGTEEIEWSNDIIVLKDGYLLVGYTNQHHSHGYDGYVVRTDLQGKVVWEKLFGGANWDFLYKGISTSDGGFLLVGETFSNSNGDADLYVVKIDPDGTLLWEKNFGGPNKDKASDVLESEEKGYLILGTWEKTKIKMKLELLIWMKREAKLKLSFLKIL